MFKCGVENPTLTVWEIATRSLFAFSFFLSIIHFEEFKLSSEVNLFGIFNLFISTKLYVLLILVTGT